MRYPFATIAPLLGSRSSSEVARLAGVQQRSVARWRQDGATISEEHADRLATALHVHPSEVWADWQDDLKRPCAECGEAFLPAYMQPRQRFCGKRCRQREWARRTYQTDEEFRARRIDAARQYHAEYGDYKAAQTRRTRAAKKAA